MADRQKSRGVAFPVLSHLLSPGTGQLMVTGGLTQQSRDAVLVAVLWVDRNLDAASRWLQARRPETEGLVVKLLKPTIDVVVTLPAILHLPKSGSSIGAAVAAGLLMRALRSLGAELKGRVAITGEVDLRGRLLPVTGIVSKLEAAFVAQCSVVVVPAANKEEVAAATRGWGEGKEAMRAWARSSVVQAAHMADVLHAILRGTTVWRVGG